MNNIELVIFANSVKHHQHCVAGKCLKTGRWIRPVSDRNGSELAHDQAKCHNPHGAFNVKPLQKVLMNFTAHAPLAHQPENYVIDGSIWRQNYTINDEDLNNYLDHPTDIWGVSDRIPYASILAGGINITQSLYLVSVQNLNLYKNQYEKRRASFSYGGLVYDLAVTDPNFDRIITKNTDTKGILCISLGEEYEGNCYKLIATIF